VRASVSDMVLVLEIDLGWQNEYTVRISVLARRCSPDGIEEFPGCNKHEISQRGDQ
jgi:hypothetical protein